MTLRQRFRIIGLTLCLALLATTAFARIPRSTAAVNDFTRANPCPVTGQWRGSCLWPLPRCCPDASGCMMGSTAIFRSTRRNLGSRTSTTGWTT